MTHWNYRVVHDTADGENIYQLIEAYYADDGGLRFWAVASSPIGESHYELVSDIQHMHEAIRRPIIEGPDLPSWHSEAEWWNRDDRMSAPMLGSRTRRFGNRIRTYMYARTVRQAKRDEQRWKNR